MNTNTKLNTAVKALRALLVGSAIGFTVSTVVGQTAYAAAAALVTEAV